MRCPSCNKFAALDFGDPDLESFDHDLTLDMNSGVVSGEVTATVRIERTSACCGDAMKEATLEMSRQIEIDHDTLERHVVFTPAAKQPSIHLPPAGTWDWKEGCGIEVEDDGAEQLEEGGGRYAKSFFGATVHYTIRCACGEGDDFEDGELEGKVAASEMDEMA